MCGIFGVHGHPDAVQLTRLGLYSLQHRGQESFGVVAVDETGAARAMKSMGLVPGAQSNGLHGILAIGHTRYSTAGASTIENAQPVLARSRGGHLALAHNGNLADAVVFASETCALDIIGARFEREVEPGEIVAADDAGVRSSSPFPRRELRRCVFEHVYFARPDSRIFGGSVDRARRQLGRRLAREHPARDADLVFSVPDSSNSAALGFAEESGLPYELALIRNHYVGRTFIQPTQAGRDAKVKVKYNAVKEVLDGKSVVMVDDSIVRGTTTRGLVAMIRAAGAREVHMRVSSAPITGPCYYGIDTPSREELIAANHTTDEIAKHLGVDTLGYLSLDGMLESVPDGPSGFCHACFSGDYPTPPPADPQKLRFGCGC